MEASSASGFWSGVQLNLGLLAKELGGTDLESFPIELQFEFRSLILWLPLIPKLPFRLLPFVAKLLFGTHLSSKPCFLFPLQRIVASLPEFTEANQWPQAVEGEARPRFCSKLHSEHLPPFHSSIRAI
jgi:hypothetical protein